MADENPCFGCESRHMTCHAGCAKYASWKQAHEEERAERRRQSELEASVTAYKVEVKRRGRALRFRDAERRRNR